MGALRLKSVEFRRERQGSWRELERLIARAEKRGVRSLEAEELSRLPILYREALSSLSVARAISLDRNVVDYLESLAGRAFLCVYGTKTRPLDAMRDFFAWRFPAAVRRARWPLLLAAIFMIFGTLTSFALTLDDPDRFYAFIPEEYAAGRTPTTPRETLRAGLYAEEREAGTLAAFSSMLFTHNSRVGLLAFGLGFVAGLPTFLLLFWNGLILGALAAAFHRNGLSGELWGWLLPHGVTELTAVALCGGAGLLLAQGLVFPGLHSRRASLALKGREAGLIVVGAVCMLLVAGLIEGVFRQTVQDVGVRYAVALATLLFWAYYFARAGEGAPMKVSRPLLPGAVGAQIERVTPEGIPVRFEIATVGDRAGAFLLDLLLIILAILVALLLAYLAGGDGWSVAILSIFAFVLQHGYFLWFEMRWQGATPGKRRYGLRVIDGRGGPLLADAVIVRNLTRSLEFFLPLGVVLSPEALWPGAPPWIRGVSSLWLILLALLPLFNRHRLRVGDLLGGTMVVVAPKAVLLADQGAGREAKGAPAFTFTDAQLDVYGIYELQVLEEVLRHSDGRDAQTKMGAVSRKIRAKIGDAAPKNIAVNPEPYLRAFYAALRARLEHRMLLGKRKEDKHAR